MFLKFLYRILRPFGGGPVFGGSLCLSVSARPGLVLSVATECGGVLALSVTAAPGLELSVTSECC